MKKILLIAAVTLMSTSAFASKARKAALSNAAHVSDFSDVLTKPDQALNHADTMALEVGGAYTGSDTATASNTGKAEGGFVRKMDNSAWGLYLNNQATSASTFRPKTGTNFLGVENGLNFIYAMGMGDMTVGGGLFYSKSSRAPDTASAGAPKASQDAMGLYVSAASKAGWDAQFALGLANNAKIDTGSGDTKMTGKTTYKLSGGYWMDTMYFYAFYQNAGAKVENTAGTATNDTTATSMALGVVNTHKKDGSEFFYGVAYNSSTTKEDVGNTKVESTGLPLVVGMEVDANSWLTLRGSITQNFFLMGTSKTSSASATTSKKDNAADTTVAAGAGLKFGKVTVDGTFAAASNTGDGTFGFDGANFMANTALTYAF